MNPLSRNEMKEFIKHSFVKVGIISPDDLIDTDTYLDGYTDEELTGIMREAADFVRALDSLRATIAQSPDELERNLYK